MVLGRCELAKKISCKKQPTTAKKVRGKPFNKGKSGNPDGRPKGSKNHDGLNDVLNMLKDFISDKKNIEALKKDFQTKFNSNPSGFFYKMVMPLLPKNIDVTSDGELINFVFNNVKRIPSGDKKK